MKLLVTGGLGHVGWPLVTHLLHRGYDVKVIDRQVENPIEGMEYAACDINDYQAIREQVRGQDAIIHLAALPDPGSGSGTEIFRINCSGTFNVYEAAAAEGIRKVVTASSINALGYNYGIKSFPIEYFPIDEDHPTFTTDPYSFSKQTVEAIGEYYWRREEISGICLRLPGVLPPMMPEWSEMIEQFLTRYRQSMSDLLAMPVEEQQKRVREAIDKFDQRRALRVMEKPHGPGIDSFDPEEQGDLMLLGYSDFWSIITIENMAHAFEACITADYEGCRILFVGERENPFGIETEVLANLFFPGVSRKRPLVGYESLVSYEKAYRLIGYDPQTSTVFD